MLGCLEFSQDEAECKQYKQNLQWLCLCLCSPRPLLENQNWGLMNATVTWWPPAHCTVLYCTVLYCTVLWPGDLLLTVSHMLPLVTSVRWAAASWLLLVSSPPPGAARDLPAGGWAGRRGSYFHVPPTTTDAQYDCYYILNFVSSNLQFTEINRWRRKIRWDEHKNVYKYIKNVLIYILNIK